jgi:hypothetical protein
MIQSTHSLKAPGFNPGTYQVRNWFQAFAFSNATCARYTEAGIPYNGFDGYFGLVPITAKMFGFLSKMSVNPNKTK